MPSASPLNCEFPLREEWSVGIEKSAVCTYIVAKEERQQDNS